MTREEIINNCVKMLVEIADGIINMPKLDVDTLKEFNGREFTFNFWNTDSFNIKTKHRCGEYSMLSVYREKWSGKNELQIKIWDWSDTSIFFSDQVSTCMDLVSEWNSLKAWVFKVTEKQNEDLKAISDFKF